MEKAVRYVDCIHWNLRARFHSSRYKQSKFTERKQKNSTKKVPTDGQRQQLQTMAPAQQEEEEEEEEEHRHTTPIAMVLHLDEEDDEEEGEEEEDEEAEEEDDEEDDEEEDVEISDDDDDEAAAAASEEDEDDDKDDDEEHQPPPENHGGQEVRIDTEGRIAGVSDCGLDFRFRSYPAAVCPPPSSSSTTTATTTADKQKNKKTKKPSKGGKTTMTTKTSSSWSRETLVADCKAAFVGESFWLDATTEPRCALESLARAVFRQHTEGAAVAAEGGGFDPSKSGAEWWVQLRHADDGQNQAVSFHWDKDEDLVDDYGVNVHPAISTVTYLTDSGAPTLVLNHRAPIMYEDLDGFRGVVSDAYLSYPKAGKHVAFDGRMLHGAPREMTREGDVPEGYLRVSFLVNVWLDYKPRGIDMFPEEELENLGLSPPLAAEEERDIRRGFQSRSLTAANPSPSGGGGRKEKKKGSGGDKSRVGGNKKAGGRGGGGGGGGDSSTSFEVVDSSRALAKDCTTFEYKFGETGTEHLLRVQVPLHALRDAARRGDVVELRWGGADRDGGGGGGTAVAEVVAQEKQPSKGKKKKKKKKEGKKGDETEKETKKERGGSEGNDVTKKVTEEEDVKSRKKPKR